LAISAITNCYRQLLVIKTAEAVFYFLKTKIYDTVLVYPSFAANFSFLDVVLTKNKMRYT